MQAWDVLRFGFGFRRFLDRHADARERIPTGRSASLPGEANRDTVKPNTRQFGGPGLAG